MIAYSKQFYPELEQSDFDEHIAPLLHYIDDLSVHPPSNLNNVNTPESQELYPYHNPCRMIARNIMIKVWDSEMDKYLLNSGLFKNAICELLSQIAFSYLIRCFAEQIKTIPKKFMNSKDVYNYYTQKLMDTGFKEFVDAYPIAWGRCNNLLENRAMAIKETIRLTQKHRLKIEEEFNIPCNSPIVSIELGGDTHNNGSSVTIITFEHGERIVFKPRSVSGELGYTNFIRRINTFISPKMTSLTVIDFGDYGFTSFEETYEEQKDMYQAGRLACLMFLLNASDMHYSNILWANDGPLPIDLETLFHPSRIRTGIPESKRSAYRALEKSVYGTGVLPISLGSKKGDSTVDVGFTGMRDQSSVSPFKIFNIKEGFSSDIKIVWNHQKINDNPLTDPDLEMFIHKRCDQVIEGFSDFFLQVFYKKNMFMAAVIKSFSSAKFRYIHNMTYRYEQLLRLLTDAEPSRNIETAHALLSRTGILSTTSDVNLVLSECQQLWEGDIPYFSVNFNGTEVFCGNEIVSYISASPKSDFLMKMKNLSKTDLIRQIKLIRLAFVAKLADPHSDGKLELRESGSIKAEGLETEGRSTEKDNNISNHKGLISWFSKNLTKELLDDRYEHLPKTWIGPVAQFGKGWTPGVLGYDLYSGRIGPALALTVAGNLLSDEDAINASYDVFEKSAKILEEGTFDLRNVLYSGIGAFSGVSGLLWSLFTAGNINKNERWKNIAINFWPILHRSLGTQDSLFFDMITGKSGSIVMRYQMQKDFKLNDAMIDKSLSLAYSKINANDDKITSGLTHGYGQLLWFFSSIYQRQVNSDIKTLIEEIDSIICKKYTNGDGIIETYINGKGKHISSSWCNGLAGLLIAYYEAYKSKVLPRESVLNIINQLKRVPISRVPILCHGSLGIAEVLQYVSESFPEETSDILFEMKASYCSPEYISKYYENGRGRYTLSPGLMGGQAGALLHLCKSLDPKIKISPLTFGV